MRILIVTDAWHPQVNGVVKTLVTVGRELTAGGHDIRYMTPAGRRSWPMPTYPEIRVTLSTAAAIGAEIDAIQPHAIHIATEGSLGWAARKACLVRDIPFTTSFHTRFAEYAHARLPLPAIERLAWAFLRRFHRPSRAVMVPTASIGGELVRHGFTNVKVWSRGVDHEAFKPGPRDHFDLPRPILLLAGRVAIEKNIEAFLRLRIAGTKVIVGDGPDRAALKAKYPDAVFTGYRQDGDFAHTLSSADVFVFPSLTDTFGLVMIEATACGTPIAAFDVPSPVDVVTRGVSGELDADLSKAIGRSLKLDREKVREASKQFTWKHTAHLFESWLVPFHYPAIKSEVPENRGFAHLR